MLVNRKEMRSYSALTDQANRAGDSRSCKMQCLLRDRPRVPARGGQVQTLNALGGRVGRNGSRGGVWS